MRCKNKNPVRALLSDEQVLRDVDPPLSSPKRTRQRTMRLSDAPSLEIYATTERKKIGSNKSFFQNVSRDSLQRYMVHYNIPRRQDLKKNLVKRVRKHFESIDGDRIDLVELQRGIIHQMRKCKNGNRLIKPGEMKRAAEAGPAYPSARVKRARSTPALKFRTAPEIFSSIGDDETTEKIEESEAEEGEEPPTLTITEEDEIHENTGETEEDQSDDVEMYHYTDNESSE